ncbi:hypothetical protein [Mycobacterium sp. 1165178.9]|uniref:hypothetical protein n=1 Tax=Mycobacterium sp. 1165178.9 TaxID=1834070 RepID=UPI0012EAA1C2|nr:hypothetical protein [Mycobacterium sp. 1165178.9]
MTSTHPGGGRRTPVLGRTAAAPSGTPAEVHPTLALLDRPTMSPMRRAGLISLRGYLVVAVVFVIIKIVQAGVVGPAASF